MHVPHNIIPGLYHTKRYVCVCRWEAASRLFRNERMHGPADSMLKAGAREVVEKTIHPKVEKYA